MNKTTLLITSVVIGVIAVSSYVFNGDETSEQPMPLDNVQVKNHEVHVNENADSQSTVTGNSSDVTSIVDENGQVRQAPPPPMSASTSRDSRDSSPKAHGHEEVSDNQKRNAPPPPVGANQ